MRRIHLNNIEIVKKINKEFLKSEDYFQSLLEEGFRVNLLKTNEVESIQTDCLLLLARQTEKYNGSESSSIKIEAASQLLSSILFTLGVYLKTYENPDLAIEDIKKEGIFNIYTKGLKQIDKLKITSKLLHKSILRKLVKTDNVFYKSTIEDGINGFFKLYYPEFGAHEIHITADYPVHQKMEPLKGIEFINKYLEWIYYENLFCSFFSSEDIHNLLSGYDKNYSDIPFNIYERVLLSALGCELAGKDYRHLEIDESSLEKLFIIFNKKTKIQIQDILKSGLEGLRRDLNLNESLMRYLNNSLNQLAVLIENSIINNTLDRVFVVPRYYDNSSKLIVSFGIKMDDEKYRKIIDEIRQCRHFSDKKNIIKLEVNSLGDLEDVLIDADLTEDEILRILDELNLGEVAALAKRNSITSIDYEPSSRSGNNILAEALDTYKAILSTQELEKFTKLIEVIVIG